MVVGCANDVATGADHSPRFASVDHPSDASGAVLPLSCTEVTFTRDGRRLLDGVNVYLDGNDVCVVLGPNGAGKSLLLQLLAGLLRADTGEVHWAHRTPDTQRRLCVGLVFQKPVLLRRSAIANLEYALSFTDKPKQLRHQLAIDALRQAGLEHIAETPARLLSGGEQQRLATARALLLHPQVLLLDEATAHLDPASTSAIEQLVTVAARQGTKVLWVTHDLAQAQRLADTVMFMHSGSIGQAMPAVAFFANPPSAQAAAYLAGKLLT